MSTWPEPADPAIKREFVVGTRGSALALAQTAIVCDALHRAHPAIALRVERINTTGDVHNDVPLVQLGRSVFVREIESALLAGRIDLAVHSAKDLPSALAPEFKLGAILPRADARDVLVSRHGTLGELPVGARVGTSSPRRVCQLRALRPDLEIVDVRGNVDTRLRKLANGEFDALVLAGAGLIRLNRVAEVTEWLDPGAFIPSVGQGALAIEVRAQDEAVLQLVRPLDDAPTRAAVIAERAFLAELGAGCQASVGAYAQMNTDDGVLRIAAFIGTPHGEQVRAIRTGPASRAKLLGIEIAHELLRKGGALFLANEAGPLSGAVVAVTRAADRSADLMMLLRAYGAQPIACPTIAIELLTNLPELDAILFANHPPTWIAFTSVNAVHAVADYLDATGLSLPDAIRLSAVGDATALAVETHFRRPDFIASEARAESLASELPDVAGATVLFPCGDLATEALITGLTSRAAKVRDVIVYRTTAGSGVADLAASARAGQLDAVVFASPSSVRFAASALDAVVRAANGAPVVVCIGPTTTRAARDLGLDPVEATSTSVGAIVEALERSLAAQASMSDVIATSGGHA